MADLQQEQEWIEAARHDPARFADLYEDNFHRVYAYVARRARDRDAAEDLTSEVFRDALAGLHRFEWQGVPFAAWLMRIASRVVGEYYVRSGRETQVEHEPVDSVPAEVEQTAMLFQLVDRLPEAQYRVIHLRFVEQKSIREIAEEMGRSEGAIKQLQLRALEALRSQMEGPHA